MVGGLGLLWWMMSSIMSPVGVVVSMSSDLVKDRNRSGV